MPATVLTPLKYFGVRMPATIASTSLSTLRNAQLVLGMVSSTPFCVVPSHESHGVPISSATGPTASVTPVEMPPSTTSTFSWSTSLRYRSTVSFGLDSSSTTSWTWRPRMPPDLFTRSAHHSVPRRPAAPTGAAMPARMASTPIFTGSEGTPLRACARATAGNPAAAAVAAAPAPLMNARRSMFMPSSVIRGSRARPRPRGSASGLGHRQAGHEALGVVGEANAVDAVGRLELAAPDERGLVVRADHGTVDRALDLVTLDGQRDLLGHRLPLGGRLGHGRTRGAAAVHLEGRRTEAADDEIAV